MTEDELCALDNYIQQLKDMGALWAKAVPKSYIVTAPWVQMKCRYGCFGWNAMHHCPPRTPTYIETQAMIDTYARAILVVWGASSDIVQNQRKARRPMHNRMLEFERILFLDGFYKAFAFNAGSCCICVNCTVSEPCKHPGEPRPSMEGCGIDVVTTMANAGYMLHMHRCLEKEYVLCGMVLVD